MAENRLSEILGALSLSTDMAAGQPPEAALCATVLGVRMGRMTGLSEAALADLYYACITRFIGCTSAAGDVAAMALGHDLTANYCYTLGDALNPDDIRHHLLSHFAPDKPDEERLPVIEACINAGAGIFQSGLPHCQQALALTRRLPVPAGVPAILAELEARWDGGNPLHKAGEDLPPATRIIEFAIVVELHRRAGGLRSMLEVAATRSGGQFAPEVCALFTDNAPELIAGLGVQSDWELYLDAEPGAPIHVGADGLRKVAEAFADFVDNKSRWFVGHSRQVAGLAFSAAVKQGVEEDECQNVFNAALLHNIGKCAVPNGIWDKPAPLTRHEELQARTHSFRTEQVLAMSPVFDPISDIACSANERCDGSGYHRRIRLSAGCPSLLAVANVYDELTRDQASRPAYANGEAAEMLLAEVSAGRLPRHETRAVLDSAGHRKSLSDKAYPDGMTAREAEVLMHLARGLTKKEIARVLDVAPKTVDNHTQNLYRKIGAQSRTAAAMYAFEQGIFTP